MVANCKLNTDCKNIYKMLFFLFLFFLLIFNYLPLIKVNEYVKEVNTSTGWRLDYIWHFLYYFFMVFLFFLWKNQTNSIAFFVMVLVIFSGIAVLNEFFQMWVPERSYNPLDMMFNLIGTVLGFILGVFYIKKNKTSR